MSVILRNDYGAVAVNRGVIERMIIEDMLSLSSDILMCNKKGKIIKEKPTPFIDPDYYDAVDVSDKKGHVKVVINMILAEGKTVMSVAETIFSMIEADFDILRLGKPDSISLRVRGIKDGDEVLKRNVEVVRSNA
ncbi:MAG: hypothetical protein J5961_02155 [Mogibacterium sp.]|nr:hypothetical protein [Mogibacterium sp.]